MRAPVTHLRQVVANASWLGGARVFRMVVNFVVSAWVARTLGAENLGILAHVQAGLSLLAAAAAFGTNAVAVRELRRAPSSPAVLGATFVLRLLAGTICALLGIGTAFLLASGAAGVKEAWLFAVLAVSLPLQAFDTLDFWLLSRMDARGSAMAHNVASLVGAALRSGACLLRGGVFAFAWAQALEAVAGAVSLLHRVRRGVALRDLFRADGATVRHLLRSSWPLAVSDICVTLSLQADRLLLQRALGSLAVGLYSAGARLSEWWYLVPMSLGVAALPILVRTAEIDERQVDRNLRSTYRLATWISLIIAVPTTLFADFIVLVVFGDRYPGAGAVLAIHIWSLPGLSHVSIRNTALIASGCERLVALLMGLGAATNIVLNLVLIPRWHIQGAALAAVLTWSLSALVYPLAWPSTRHHVALLVRSFAVPWGAVFKRG